MASKLKPIILFACGSFNPPTIMHLRLFELAKDHLQDQGYRVLGGVISPTNDKYNKKGLISSVHRLEMARLALEDYSFVKLSPWEVEQAEWSRTRLVLDTHQDLITKFCQGSEEKQPWMPDNLSPLNESDPGEIPKLVFICGADLLESFSVPNLWMESDIERIVQMYGLAVITREGCDPEKYIYGHDILNKFKENIHIATERVPNMISSTCIRLAIRRGHSIKFLVPNPVINYVNQNNLYRKESDAYATDIEYSCMPLPQSPVVTYFPEQSTQETQITNETSESETQTSGVSTESQNTQVAADTTEMTTQTKRLVQSEMTTQTKTRAHSETTTQTKTRPQTETTTQTKARPLTETTTQTKTRPLAETTTQTSRTTSTTVGSDTSEMTVQTKIVAQNDVTPIFDESHDDEDMNVPVSDVKIVLEMHHDDNENDEEADMIDFPPPMDVIVDGVDSGNCCSQTELCSACPELSAVSGDGDADSKVDENECSFSCSSECSSCSCLDPSHTLESQMSPNLSNLNNAQPLDGFEPEMMPCCESSYDDLPLPSQPCWAPEPSSQVMQQVKSEVLETGDDKDDTDEPTLVSSSKVPDEVEEEREKAMSNNKPNEVLNEVPAVPPVEAPVKEHKSKSRSSSKHGDRSEKGSAAPAVQFEITARGVRVISEKESFL